MFWGFDDRFMIVVPSLQGVSSTGSSTKQNEERLVWSGSSAPGMKIEYLTTGSNKYPRAFHDISKQRYYISCSMMLMDSDLLHVERFPGINIFHQSKPC